MQNTTIKSSLHKNTCFVKSNLLNSPPAEPGRLKTDIHNTTNNTSIDSCEYLFQAQTLAELKDMVEGQLSLAGLFKEAQAVDECGRTCSVYECEECGQRPGRIFHCDHRFCPRCHYRQLFRFFRTHRSQWAGVNPITITSTSYGTWLTDDIELALKESHALHQKLFQDFWRTNGGVYYRETRLTDDGSSYEVIYHYMLDCHPSTLLFLGLRLGGYAALRGYRAFGSYEAAYRFFLKEHCPYPTSVVLRGDLLRPYLKALRHRRLIQGFGSLYRVSGGRGRSKQEVAEYRCPFCNGKCHFYIRVPLDRVKWNHEYKTYYLE